MNGKKQETLLYAIRNIYNKSLDKIDEECTLSICDYLLKGNLFVRAKHVPQTFTYEEELKYELNNFNWDINYQPAPNLCQLFLQGFSPIKHLLEGYELTYNMEYLELSASLIRSWLNYEKNSKSEFTWYDHSVCDRVIVMIYFNLILQKNMISQYDTLVETLNTSIKNHADFLYNDENYTTQNHGTMIDRALYIIAIYLNDENSIKYKKSH